MCCDTQGGRGPYQCACPLSLALLHLQFGVHPALGILQRHGQHARYFGLPCSLEVDCLDVTDSGNGTFVKKGDRLSRERVVILELDQGGEGVSAVQFRTPTPAVWQQDPQGRGLSIYFSGLGAVWNSLIHSENFQYTQVRGVPSPFIICNSRGQNGEMGEMGGGGGDEPK